MSISAIGSSGLSATASALRTSQARFDAAAEQTVADAAALADPEAAGGGNLAQDTVGMQAERLTNAVLAGVFRRQVDLQKDLVETIAPR